MCFSYFFWTSFVNRDMQNSASFCTLHLTMYIMQDSKSLQCKKLLMLQDSTDIWSRKLDGVCPLKRRKILAK